MSSEEYLLLNEHISGRFGISFSEPRRQVLEIRLRPRLKALRLRSFRDYYLYLQCDTNGESQKLAEAVTNNETYFFREPEVLSDLLAAAPGLAGRDGTLRVLCAGCSSAGAEPEPQPSPSGCTDPGTAGCVVASDRQRARAPQVSEADARELALGNTAFALELYRLPERVGG